MDTRIKFRNIIFEDFLCWSVVQIIYHCYMPSNSIPLSVILPCFNPRPDWFEIVMQDFLILEDEQKKVELIIVNDGSSKNFTEAEVISFFLKQPAIKIISYSENKGKGYALREGVKQAQGDLIIYTDIDFPYTHDSFRKIYNPLKNEDADVAIGIRSEEYYAHLSKSRVRISKLLRWFIKKFLRIPTDDTQCGLKGMNQKGKQVFLQTTIDRYLFDLEFIFLSARQKLSVKTVEVELRPEIQLSKMNWKILLQEFGNFLKIFAKSVF